jgi:hypothetical protein
MERLRLAAKESSRVMKIMPDIIRSVICFFMGAYASSHGEFLAAYIAGCGVFYYLASALREFNSQPEE